MKNKNICRVIPRSVNDGLEIVNFIYETDRETMKKGMRWKANSMILVVQGEGNFLFDDKKVRFVPGSLVFGFKGDLFSVEEQEAVEYMYISFNGIRGEELLRRFGISPACRSLSGFEGLIPLWKNSLSRTAEANIDLAAESILLHTFSKFDAELNEGNVLIKRIVELTEDNYTDSELSLSTLSGELGYNSKYLSGFFKEKMGVNYSEYLRNMRIEYAVSLFDYGIDSVKNVALLSGFKDPLYFSTVFKRVVGVAPSDYMGSTKTQME